MEMNFELRNLCLLAGLLSLLSASALFGARRAQRLRNDTWGGEHIRIEVKDGSAEVEYDCAHGSIAAPLTIDRQGRFGWRGTYTRERGGPVRFGDRSTQRPATYEGTISRDEMTLTVKLENSSDEPETYKLHRGNPGRVWKCK